MWTPILNWWRTSVGDYPTVYIYSTLFYFGLYKYIVHIVHNLPEAAPLLALRVGHTVVFFLSTELSNLSTNCLFFKQCYAKCA